LREISASAGIWFSPWKNAKLAMDLGINSKFISLFSRCNVLRFVQLKPSEVSLIEFVYTGRRRFDDLILCEGYQVLRFSVFRESLWSN